MYRFSSKLVASYLFSSLLSQNLFAFALDEMQQMFELSFPSSNCSVENIELTTEIAPRVLKLDLKSEIYSGPLEFAEDPMDDLYEIDLGQSSSGVPYWRIVGEFKQASTENTELIPLSLDWKVDLGTKKNEVFLLNGLKDGKEINLDCSR